MLVANGIAVVADDTASTHISQQPMGTKGISKMEAELAKLSQSGVAELCGLMLGRKEVGSSKLSIWKLSISKLG